MSRMNSAINARVINTRDEKRVEGKKRTDALASIFIAIYILSIYIPPKIVPAGISSGMLYAFLGMTFLKLITRQTSLKITPHSIWFFFFGILGLFSRFYATDPDLVDSALYILLVSWVVSFSFAQYVQNNSSFKRLFFFFSTFPIPLIIFLFLSGGLNLQSGERLGESLYGNANRLAVYLMITLFCICWFIVYAKRKYLLVNIPLAVVIFYVTALTGGRKYLIIPFIFFFLLVVFKNWNNNKPGLVVYTLMFIVVVGLVSWAIMNVPALYDSIGVRFEGLFNIVNGNFVDADDSSLVRYWMIRIGWKNFLKQPVIGYGLNNFAYLYTKLTSVYSHNNFIEMLVDLGLVGFLVYYSFYAYILIRLIGIQNDVSGVRDFFLAYMLVLFIFEVGNVTYNYLPIHIFIGLASAYVWLYDKNRRKIAVQQGPGYKKVVQLNRKAGDVLPTSNWSEMQISR